jgi:uncharacterized protein (TIGR02145 family)
MDVEEAKATENYDTYGVLYNWPAVMTEDICPSGWHVPSYTEFNQLISFVGGEDVAGCALKEVGNNYWNDNYCATNSSGFSALGGGIYAGALGEGAFYQLGIRTYFQTTSLSGYYDDNLTRPYSLWVEHYRQDVEWGLNKRHMGIYARCIKD